MRANGAFKIAIRYSNVKEHRRFAGSSQDPWIACVMV